MMHEIKEGRFMQSVYWKSGEGYPIVLLHGFAEDHRIWKHQIAFLAEHYTVIVPDLPGSGLSPLPDEHMSIELLAEFVLNILEQERLKQVILFGHSMGGYIALAFAEKYASRLSGFSLVHSSAYADDDVKKENRRKSIRLIENEGGALFVKAMVPNLYGEKAKLALQDELMMHIDMALQIPGTSLQAYYRAMIERPDRTAVLINANFPVQFIIGMEDNAVLPADAIAQSALPPISDVHLLPTVGHCGMIEATAEVNSMINSFCKYLLKR